MTTKKYDRLWGYEIEIENNELYCGKILYVKKGYRSSRHKHFKKDETYYIYKGLIMLEYDNERFFLNIGDEFNIQHEHWHRFTALEDTEIFEVSTHHDDNDAEKSVLGGKVAKLPEIPRQMRLLCI